MEPGRMEHRIVQVERALDVAALAAGLVLRLGWPEWHMALTRPMHYARRTRGHASSPGEAGTTMFPRDGQCDLHGVYLICPKMIGDKTTSVMYRLDDAKDGSDSKVLSVWSQEW